MHPTHAALDRTASAGLALRPLPRSLDRSGTSDFAGELDAAIAQPDATDGGPDAERAARTAAQVRADARGHAETLVAQSLIAPLLAELRATNRAAEPFGVSDAEKRLGPIFDEHIATQVVRRADFDLVKQVEASILKRAGVDGAERSGERRS